jgi:outer membrane protein insertion porin family/translocation and assembly module TamA
VDPSPLLEGLATVPSAKFLGIWDGVAFEYEVYDREVLSKDLLRVERYLRARGYYEAKVVAARVIRTDEQHVRVEIRVHEGAQVSVRSIRLGGLETVSVAVAAEALRANPLRTGRAFDEALYSSSKARILRVLRDSGYAFAKVLGKVQVDVATHSADVEFKISTGPPTTYGEIKIVGLNEVPEEQVRRALQLQPGEAFSQSSLEGARRALLSLGVFTSVVVTASHEDAQGSAVPVHVAVEEAKLRTARFGGGAQLDALQLSNHMTFGWEHRNFLGGLRRLKLDAKPGVIYFPTRLGNLELPDRYLLQHQVKAEFRRPAFLEGRTTGVLTSAFNVYPLLFAETAEDEAIVGFAEFKWTAGVERAFWEDRVIVTPSLNWQLEIPIDYNLLTAGRRVTADAELLDNLLIAFPEALVFLDLRDDKLNTRSGALFSTSLQVASPLLGSHISDFRIEPEARLFVPISPSVTFATRLTVGFLFTGDYAQTLQDPEGYSPAELARDTQKLLFRGFFSGGPNSNRGYPLRGVGPHGEIPFLLGNTDCTLPFNERTCNRPLGGLSLWETSFEVRFPLVGALGAVTFVDMSDVNRRRQLRFTAPHLSPGMGFRYLTPVGPVRLDFGYRVPGAQAFGGVQAEGYASQLFDAPIAAHLSLGEAF